MTGIVCAIRGGPDSKITIDKAIDLAKQMNLPLYFLYVVNLEFLRHTITNRVQVAEDEIRKMGEFILLNTQQLAFTKGVSSVHPVSRVGNVRDEIISLCNQIQADYVVLGRPVEENGNNLLAGKGLQDFLTKLNTECQAQVVFSREGS